MEGKDEEWAERRSLSGRERLVRMNERNDEMPRIQFNGAETPIEMPLAPVGVPVDFTIERAELKDSKSGKPMLEVEMRIQGTDADGDLIFDYLTEPMSSKRTQIRLNRLAKAVGLAVGPEGIDTEELIGKSGKFVLKADVYQGQEKRKLQDYVVEG